MTKETILLIENSDEIRYLLKKALSRLDRYHVLEAADGEIGLQRAYPGTSVSSRRSEAGAVGARPPATNWRFSVPVAP